MMRCRIGWRFWRAINLVANAGTLHPSRARFNHNKRRPNKRINRARGRRQGEEHMQPIPALRLLLAGCLLAAGASAAQSQAWPTRTVTAISPFTAGNANDMVARVVLDQVSKQVGQPFVLENRPGAGGAIGVNTVAKASPDGYTVLLHSSSLSSLPVMHRKLPYDALKDFTGVAMFGVQPTVLVTAPSKGWKTVHDLIAAAKAKPGAMFFASAGIGSASHMAAEQFRLAAGFQAQHVPFRGPTEAFAEIVSGRLDFYFLPLAPALNLVKSGKVVALMVGAKARTPLLPDVPTTVELGWPEATYEFWGGLSVPTKTPRAVVDRLNAEATKAMAMPEVRERVAKFSVQLVAMTADQFDKYFRDDIARMAKVAQGAGIKPVD
jgi:tripartite-type tricarboxylate transporter receptor subunit TctC